MKKKILIIAPHTDDETLGCGGTILKNLDEGNIVCCLIVTKLKEQPLKNRKKLELKRVMSKYPIKFYKQLDFEPARLDTIPKQRIIKSIKEYLDKIKPSEIYIPYENDAHSDHKIVFNCVTAISKSFRSKYIKKVLVYETPSETDINLDHRLPNFKPNLYVDISKYIKKKIDILSLYKSEIGEHPFPRSLKNIRALATYRGSMSNFKSAEAFIILKERI
tara:strand:+ start:750 stop:1406 length:657 start_codon:yes stop_codon:yes gene_type:complete